MSELIFTWLNDEVQLSSKISNFEKDFSNGYYFGELLSKYNQQLNFREFKNLNIRDAKIKNFNLLKPTFDTLKVKFDNCIVEGIIEGKKDVVPHLLYQLKMALEKVNNPADVIVNNKAGKYNTVIPLMKINPPIEQYAKMDAKFFDERLCAQNRPQKSINLDNHLQKFPKFKVEQDSIIKQQEIIAQEREKSVKEQMRKIELNKLQRNMAFQEDWNEKGLEQWKKNQEVTKERVKTDRTFKAKTLNREETRKTNQSNTQKYETNRDIDHFEDILKKKGLGIPEEDENGNIIKKEHKHTVSATATMKRIKEKSQVNEFLSKERDKRRRKMIVDQAKLQRDIEVKKREELVLKKLEQQSRQEKEIEYEVWRAYQCKKIILENRQLRDEKYKQKNEVNVINAKYKEEELLKILREENKVDIQSKFIRQREIEIRKKQECRKVVHQECGQIVDILINLADICYLQQQQQDSESLDDHFFNDLLKLFVDQKDLVDQKQLPEENIIEGLQEQEKANEVSKQFLSNKELQDYIESQGDWIAQHNFENNQISDFVNLDEKYIPNSPLNNYLLGDIVVQLLQEQYKDELQLQSKEEFNYLDLMPIKLSIIGYQFSGKKTLASCIERKYGIKVLQVDQLIKDLLSKWEKYNKQMKLANNKANKIGSGGDRINTASDKNSARVDGNENRLGSPDSRIGSVDNNNRVGTGYEDEEEIIELDEFSQELAKQIEQFLFSGRDLPDELYVQLILKEIFGIMPSVSAEEFLKEYRQRQMPSSSELDSRAKNLVLMQDLQLPQNKEDNFRKALVNRTYVYTSGVAILDFPHNYNQAKLLEAQLSKFIPVDERKTNQFEVNLNKAKQIVKPTQQIVKQRDLVKPGLDLVIEVNISKQESLRRALGRRYDPVSKQHFHLDDNPPPVDNAPLIERLEQIKVQGYSELTIVDKNCEKDYCLSELKEWYTMFGHKYINQDQKIDSKDQNKNRRSVQDEEYNDEELENEAQQFQEEGYANGGQVEEGQEQFNEGRQDTNQEFQQQNEQNKEKIPVQEERLLVWQEVSGTQKTDEVFYNADKLIDRVLKIKENKYQQLQNKLDAIEEQKRLDEEIARIKLENEPKLLFSTKEEIAESVAQATSAMKLDPQALQSLISLWESTLDQYLTSTQNTLFLINEQKQVVYVILHDLQKRFLELVQRPDQKFIHVKQYQEEYNKFVELNPDMCEEENTKEELHQRVEDLHDLLYDIIEAKRDEALEERNQIIKSQWIEREMERFVLLVHKLLSAELSRSFSCQQFIADYYALLQGNEIPEVPEYFKAEVSQSQEGLPPVEENGGFPRLEKIVELTLKLHQGEEEQEEKPGAKKGGKQPPKKEDKKQPKKGGKGAVEEVEEKKELTPLEKSSKEAINMEKAIFRYRVQVIKNCAISKLKQMRAQANLLFGKLQDWIDYTFKVENDAVNEMDAIYREYIEQEKKIQQEIQLNYVDVIISHKTLNFLTPLPIILPAKETIYPEKFTISQLYIIIEELKSITNETNLIESRSLLQLFTRKTNNKLSKKDLPEVWRSNSIKNYQALIERLDPSEGGYINSKDICTFICLFGSSIPTPQEQDNYLHELQSIAGGHEEISRQEFTQTSAWFDIEESSRLELNTNLFDRPKYLKELMFYIHKDTETELMDIKSLIISVSAQEYLIKGHIENAQTYHNLLFSSSK